MNPYSLFQLPADLAETRACGVDRRAALARLGGIAAATAAIWTLPQAVAAADAPAGKVSRLKGSAMARRLRGSAKLAEGAAVFPLDLLQTEAETRLEVTFSDGSMLTLGDKTELQIDGYAYDQAAGSGKQFLAITAGVFRMVTGNVSKLPASPFQVRTPVATIGVRGTDFWGFQEASRLDLALLGGAGVWAQTRVGRVEITQLRGRVVIGGFDQAPGPVEVLTEAQIAEAAKTVQF